nr:MAG TPA: hypothetical protein [Bacteriophage sp.]DAH37786.1 MAG TPA: hypothetical protein [Caudoviricetes sp.]
MSVTILGSDPRSSLLIAAFYSLLELDISLFISL